ncbi:DUF742 domain-containing protein [Actinokineospora sp.]|uniref:DUF742 domain-containing protein n=1 Tax=Actinokineospora sp. TaxID=1872133 RepID=UPI0040378669
MSTGRRATGRRTEDDFSYRDLFDTDAGFGTPGGRSRDLVDEPERRLADMSERGWEDLPEHGLGDPPNRFDIDGFRARLFGGPSATLYGDPGIPAQSDWDSKEIPAVPEHDPEPEFTEPAPHETGSLVRPYTKTGGRTRSAYDHDLAIEALVSTSERGRIPDGAVRPEYRSICGLCLDTRSVAEVAAHLRLPLGVARVLIGDMAGMGLVSIHQSGMVVGDRPSIEFMERVLSGLRRL